MEATSHPKMLPVLILMVAVALAALTLVAVPAAEGATIVVPDDYSTIQDAIDNANAGDTIRVHAGTYSENLVIDTQVEIVGNGTQETFVQTSVPTAVDVNADGTVLSKLNITGGGTSGIYIKGENCTVEDVNVSGYSRGLRTNGAHWLYIGNSSFTSNTDFGMIIHLSNNVTIHGCTIDDTPGEDGIRVNSDISNVTITNCTINSSGLWGIEFLGPNQDVVIANCVITNSSFDGVFADSMTRLEFRDNTVMYSIDLALFVFFGIDINIIDNTIVSNGWGFYLDNCDGAEISGNTIRDNEGLGIGLFDSGATDMIWIHHNHLENNAHIFGGTDSAINIAGFSRSRFNVIEDNTIVGNHKGIVFMFGGSRDNTVRRNLIKDNGVGVQNNGGARANIFYHNNFINNTLHVLSPQTTDRWDSGYPNGGNYWDTYSGRDLYSGPAQDVMGPDQLGDTPHILGSTIGDTYPLVRQWGDNPLASVAIIEPADGDFVAGLVVAEAIASGDEVSVVEWYLEGTLVGADRTEPYQLVLDTTTLMEDMSYNLTAMAHVRFSAAISDTLTVTVNNMPSVGLNITLTTVSNTYTPDQRVTAIVALQGVSPTDSAVITAIYNDTAGSIVYLPSMSTTTLTTYGFTFLLPSDVAVGNVTLWVTVMAYQMSSHVWTSSNSTMFVVDGMSQSDQLAAIADQLADIVDDIDGMNQTGVAERASALAQILADLDGLDDGIQARMDALEGSIADNTSALQEYIALQTEQISLLMDDLNASLAMQLAVINASLAEFRAEAGMGMVAIADYLMEMEANGSARHGEVLAGLDETMALVEAVNDTTLDELRTMMVDLSNDLVELDDAEAARHANTVDVMVMRLDGLSNQVGDGFNSTESQLAALSDLETIMAQLNAISDDVADIKESTEGGGSSTLNLGLILAFGVITIILLIVLMGRIRALSDMPPQPSPREPQPVVAPPKEVVEEPVETESFELMLEEPEMYPDTEGPIMMTPPEAPPEAPPEVPPEPPSMVAPMEPPDLHYETPPEVPPAELEIEPEVPPAPEPEEVPPVPEPEPPEVPPPPIVDVPEAPPYEPYEVPQEAAEPVQEPELEPEPEPEPAPEPEPEPVPEPEIEEVPAPEGELEPAPDFELEPAPEEQVPDAEQPEEVPGEKKKSAQDWVLEEVMEEIEEPKE
ncbi:MAG: right-handed parallel beta-helix repeat-containing protein [Thermoplasmata archaeon]|nr:MAG: right-handed parallel beta-helix repeat-containing protein [Thermoplasmata archaeon]